MKLLAKHCAQQPETDTTLELEKDNSSILFYKRGL